MEEQVGPIAVPADSRCRPWWLVARVYPICMLMLSFPVMASSLVAWGYAAWCVGSTIMAYFTGGPPVQVDWFGGMLHKTASLDASSCSTFIVFRLSLAVVTRMFRLLSRKGAERLFRPGLSEFLIRLGLIGTVYSLALPALLYKPDEGLNPDIIGVVMSAAVLSTLVASVSAYVLMPALEGLHAKVVGQVPTSPRPSAGAVVAAQVDSLSRGLETANSRIGRFAEALAGGTQVIEQVAQIAAALPDLRAELLALKGSVHAIGPALRGMSVDLKANTAAVVEMKPSLALPVEQLAAVAKGVEPLVYLPQIVKGFQSAFEVLSGVLVALNKGQEDITKGQRDQSVVLAGMRGELSEAKSSLDTLGTNAVPALTGMTAQLTAAATQLSGMVVALELQSENETAINGLQERVRSLQQAVKKLRSRFPLPATLPHRGWLIRSLSWFNPLRKRGDSC